MMVSALLILFFHLWINLGSSIPEAFIKQLAYIGVDMFFFLSAYSLANREPLRYGKFIWQRFKAVYIKYILFAVIAAIIGSWPLIRFLQVICGVELFTKGGGAFLWFVPAIMICYLLFPLYKKWDEHCKKRWVPLCVVLVAWIALSAILTYATGYTKIFIFTNRLPIFFLGYYMARSNRVKPLIGERASNRWFVPVFGTVLTLIGLVIGYFFGFTLKIKVPFVDMFYVVMIPLTLGLILLTSLIPEKKPIKWIGSSTLEMYAIQMVFGYKLANLLIRQFRTGLAGKLATNFITFLIIIVAAVLVHYLYGFIVKRIEK